MKSRTYIAICGSSTEIEFESEHRLHSAGNMADAEAASRRMFGYVKRIDQIQLSNRDKGGYPQPAPVDPVLTDNEAAVIRAAFADGRLTRAYMGAKVDGLLAFGDIKAAHGWSWSEFQRAVAKIR